MNKIEPIVDQITLRGADILIDLQQVSSLLLMLKFRYHEEICLL
jgi:hypothetical protein